jgi:UDP-galactopyranose mutase
LRSQGRSFEFRGVGMVVKRKIIDEFETVSIRDYTEIVNKSLAGAYEKSKINVYIPSDVTLPELREYAFKVQEQLSDISFDLAKIRKVLSFFDGRLKNSITSLLGRINVNELDEEGNPVVDDQGNQVYVKFKNKETREAWVYSQEDIQKMHRIVITSTAMEKELSAVYSAIDKQLITIWTMAKIWTDGPNV